MGKQVGFYMSEADEAEFFAWLQERHPTRVEIECVEHGEAESVDRPSGPLRRSDDSYHLWRPGLEPPPNRTLVASRLCVESRSQTIEFTRVSMHEWGPRPGRIYLNTDRGPGPDLVRWYNHLAGWIRRNCRRDAQGIYWAPEAARRWPHDALLAWDVLRRANVLASGGMPERALEQYDELVERFGDHEHPLVREAVARALLEKGRTLVALARNTEADTAFRSALERTQGRLSSGPPGRSDLSSRRIGAVGMGSGSSARPCILGQGHDAGRRNSGPCWPSGPEQHAEAGQGRRSGAAIRRVLPLRPAPGGWGRRRRAAVQRLMGGHSI